MLGQRPVLDGPLTNALAHVVQNVFFLTVSEIDTLSAPQTAARIFARAQPIESYDFGWIRGVTENGISYSIAAGHCSQVTNPLKNHRPHRLRHLFHWRNDLSSINTFLLQHHRAHLEPEVQDRPITYRTCMVPHVKSDKSCHFDDVVASAGAATMSGTIAALAPPKQGRG